MAAPGDRHFSLDFPFLFSYIPLTTTISHPHFRLLCRRLNIFFLSMATAISKRSPRQIDNSVRIQPETENITDAQYYELEVSRARRSSGISLPIWQFEGIIVAAGVIGAIFGHQTKPTKWGTEFLAIGLIVGLAFGAMIKDWIRNRICRRPNRK